MPTPGRTTFCYQLAAMESALAASHLAAAGYLRLVQGQQKMFGIPVERRKTLNAPHRPWAKSTRARLEDHYGRRTHDVDIERL